MHIKERQGWIRYAIVAACISAASAIPATHARAATARGTLIVGATVEARCTVSGAAVGAGIASRASVAVTGALTFSCTTGSAYAIGLSTGNTGNTGGATFNAAPASSLSLPDRQSDATVSAGTGNGSTQTVSMTGLIPRGNDNAAARAFDDVIMATITF